MYHAIFDISDNIWYLIVHALLFLHLDYLSTNTHFNV